MATKWELHLNREDRLAIATASRLLRKVYDISTYQMARKIGFSIYYLSQVEREDKYPAGDTIIKAIANYFGLDFLHLVEIGNQCKTPIDTFLYLQKIGRLKR
jgi:transcriptional regulator with XRE-family HTH domain